MSKKAEKLLEAYLKQHEENNKPNNVHTDITEQIFDQLRTEVFDIKYQNGDKYRGELAGDQRHGVGQFTYANGSSVIGEFRDNYL